MITIFVTTMQIRCKVGQVPCLHQQTFCWFNKSENEVNSATPCVCLRECESSRFTLYKAGVGCTCFRARVFTMMILMTMMTMLMRVMMMNVMLMMRVRCHWMQISKARRQKLRPRFESINMRTEQALVQIHKYKFTNKKNGPAMLPFHQYVPASAVVAKLYKYIANSNYKYICNRFLRKQIQKNTGSYYANTAQMQLSNALLRWRLQI